MRCRFSRRSDNAVQPSFPRRREPSAWRIDQSGEVQMMRCIANGKDRLDSVPTEFRTPHASKGSVVLSGSSRKPRDTAWLSSRLGASWLPLGSRLRGNVGSAHWLPRKNLHLTKRRVRFKVSPRNPSRARKQADNSPLPPNFVPAGPPIAIARATVRAVDSGVRSRGSGSLCSPTPIRRLALPESASRD